MSPLNILKSSELINTMAISKKVILGLEIALLGMVIVFSILIILIFSLKIIKNIFYVEEDKEINNMNVKSLTENNEIKYERKIIAIITTALYTGYYSKGQYKINSITRVEDNVPIWGRVVRAGGDIINKKKF